jgi:phage baseplate assembly protein W
MPIGLYFPFKETDNGGIIRPTNTTIESTKSNLIAFLTLRRGQRPMNNALYSPLYDFIFEPFDSISEKELIEAVDTKLTKYFPEIDLSEIKLDFEEEANLLHVEVVYSIPFYGDAKDSVKLAFDKNEK